LGSFGGFDWRARLAEVKAPRLVIRGARGKIPLVGNREWAESQENARLWVVENAGHWPHYERPEAAPTAPQG
jgi:pimeloyl-ACP methyl ester carboxylesterase